MNCHGYLIGILKSTDVHTKRQYKDKHSPETLTTAMFLKALICHHTSASLSPLGFSGWWGYSKQSNPACSKELLFLPIYSEIRWSHHSFRATGTNERVGKTDVNMYMCWKLSPVLSCSLNSILLLQHWSNPVLISLDRLS